MHSETTPPDEEESLVPPEEQLTAPPKPLAAESASDSEAEKATIAPWVRSLPQHAA